MRVKENKISKKEILEHYQNQGVRKAILSAGKVGRSRRALISYGTNSSRGEGSLTRSGEKKK